jgi:hypothetical protein
MEVITVAMDGTTEATVIITVEMGGTMEVAVIKQQSSFFFVAFVCYAVFFVKCNKCNNEINGK